MNRLTELVEDIIDARLGEIHCVIVEEILDEIIEYVLSACHKYPQIDFEDLRSIVMHRLYKRREGTEE